MVIPAHGVPGKRCHTLHQTRPMQHVRHEDLGVVAAPNSNALAISLNRELYTPNSVIVMGT